MPVLSCGPTFFVSGYLAVALFGGSPRRIRGGMESVRSDRGGGYSALLPPLVLPILFGLSDGFRFRARTCAARMDQGSTGQNSRYAAPFPSSNAAGQD
mmetsp:Transcript_20627/g.45802  ORF Transcript_20627/g.45802 Transcript_20627/m.45802 type:complete len:98 (+) Transcript_20627:127-420(+)